MEEAILTKNNSLNDFAGAWLFYTALPNLPWQKPTFIRIARFSPLIGLIIGVMQSGLWLILDKNNWPNISIASLIIVSNIIITGGIHFDGLMDTSDGLAAGKKRCLASMKDSRIGAYGLLAFAMVILIQISSLTKIGFYSPIFFPITCFWGRFSTLWAIENFTYLNSENKQSFHHKNWKGLEEFMPSLFALIIISISISTLFNSGNIIFKIILILAIGLLTGSAVPHLLGSLIGGHNGDSYGASVVLTETIFIFIIATFSQVILL